MADVTIERSGRTLGEMAQAWLESGRGKKGPWNAPTRERYGRVVWQQVLAFADPTRRSLGETKLRDVTADHVAAWSQGNEQALAPCSKWRWKVALPVFAACPAIGVPLTLSIAPVTCPEKSAARGRSERAIAGEQSGEALARRRLGQISVR